MSLQKRFSLNCQGKLYRGVMAIRSLLRNQQPVFYKLYEGQEEIIDAYGERHWKLCPNLQ